MNDVSSVQPCIHLYVCTLGLEEKRLSLSIARTKNVHSCTLCTSTLLCTRSMELKETWRLLYHLQNVFILMRHDSYSKNCFMNNRNWLTI